MGMINSTQKPVEVITRYVCPFCNTQYDLQSHAEHCCQGHQVIQKITNGQKKTEFHATPFGFGPCTFANTIKVRFDNKKILNYQLAVNVTTLWQTNMMWDSQCEVLDIYYKSTDSVFPEVICVKINDKHYRYALVNQVCGKKNTS